MFGRITRLFKDKFGIKAQMHSATSIAAATKIKPTAKTMRELVFVQIQKSGLVGATDEEVQNALGMNPNTQRPRRVELVEAGRVCDSGTTRKTSSGRDAVVWVSKDLRSSDTFRFDV